MVGIRCPTCQIGYVLGLAPNPALLRAAGPQTDAARWLFDWTGQPQRLCGTFAYAAGTWDRPRRVIVKAEHTAKGANPRFVVTNVPGDPQELYEDVYCQRGDWSCSRTAPVATASWPTSFACC